MIAATAKNSAMIFTVRLRKCRIPMGRQELKVKG